VIDNYGSYRKTEGKASLNDGAKKIARHRRSGWEIDMDLRNSDE
jgi:hypothetical protein